MSRSSACKTSPCKAVRSFFIDFILILCGFLTAGGNVSPTTTHCDQDVARSFCCPLSSPHARVSLFTWLYCPSTCNMIRHRSFFPVYERRIRDELAAFNLTRACCCPRVLYLQHKCHFCVHTRVRSARVPHHGQGHDQLRRRDRLGAHPPLAPPVRHAPFCLRFRVST